jgi:ABC-type transporter Mla maintaining outer membrane lipid asymmetry permease subunit MlaE
MKESGEPPTRTSMADESAAIRCEQADPATLKLHVSGRTGAAIAVQLGTMQVNEEIDALVTAQSRAIESFSREVAVAIVRLSK